MHDAHELLADLNASGRELRAHIPEVYSGYVRMSSGAMGDGALSAAMKELIALAIAVTRECDGCVASHARGGGAQGRDRAGGRRGPRSGDNDERRPGDGVGAAGVRRVP
ncbi:MAG: carboxymuconolactone decarboxylase family protein [Streptosporangiaceae bacterium]